MSAIWKAKVRLSSSAHSGDVDAPPLSSLSKSMLPPPLELGWLRTTDPPAPLERSRADGRKAPGPPLLGLSAPLPLEGEPLDIEGENFVENRLIMEKCCTRWKDGGGKALKNDVSFN